MTELVQIDVPQQRAPEQNLRRWHCHGCGHASPPARHLWEIIRYQDAHDCKV